MGMKTIWIENDEPWAKEFSNNDFVNYRTNNLPVSYTHLTLPTTPYV